MEVSESHQTSPVDPHDATGFAQTCINHGDEWHLSKRINILSIDGLNLEMAERLLATPLTTFTKPR